MRPVIVRMKVKVPENSKRISVRELQNIVNNFTEILRKVTSFLSIIAREKMCLPISSYSNPIYRADMNRENSD